jgi:hypothetical protein
MFEIGVAEDYFGLQRKKRQASFADLPLFLLR